MSRLKTFSISLGALALAMFGYWMWRVAQQPLQPVHRTMAHVVAIVPLESKFWANRDRIVVRARHGTGTFTMNHSEIRCDVGDEVPVQQEGITLSRLPATCR